MKRILNLSLFTVIVIALFIPLSGCTSIQINRTKAARLEYYAVDENYIVRNIEIDLLSGKGKLNDGWIRGNVLNEDGATINKQYVIDHYSNQILEENGFWDKVKIGSIVTIKTAERVFYELQKPPIVEIIVADNTYLRFDVGKSNLLKSIEEE